MRHAHAEKGKIAYETGEEVIISRGNTPIPRLVALDERRQRLAAIEAVRAFRTPAQPVTQEEIRS